jgi:hypothetical protein
MDGNISPQSPLGYNDSTSAATRLTYVRGKRPISFPLSERLAGDVGGQRTLRPYWRNYFEQTDALVWVVDSSDRLRLGDCKEELHRLLLEDVRTFILFGDIPCNVTVSTSEIGRRILACLRQQARHTGLYDGQGYRAG